MILPDNLAEEKYGRKVSNYPLWGLPQRSLNPDLVLGRVSSESPSRMIISIKDDQRNVKTQWRRRNDLGPYVHFIRLNVLMTGANTGHCHS